MFSGGKNGKVFLWNSFGHPKKMLKQADLSLFLFGHSFVISASDSFYKYIILLNIQHCSVKLVIME